PPVAGQPFNTTTIFGNQEVGDNGPRSGLRLRAAYVTDCGLGAELGGFVLERSVGNFTADPAAALAVTTLARPFVDPTTGLEGLNVLNLGTALAGSATVSSYTKLWGAEANVVQRTDLGVVEGFFGGYRYLALREELKITDRTTTQTGGVGFFNGLPVDE